MPKHIILGDFRAKNIKTQSYIILVDFCLGDILFSLFGQSSSAAAAASNSQKRRRHHTAQMSNNGGAS
jgi:phosphotransferase system  glucose/maltose/N-acetylglucosamine-specific IIC component